MSSLITTMYVHCLSLFSMPRTYIALESSLRWATTDDSLIIQYFKYLYIRLTSSSETLSVADHVSFAAMQGQGDLSSPEMRVKGRAAISYDNSPRQHSEAVVYEKQ